MNNEAVLITGGSSDLGRVLIRRLWSSGAKPLILAHCNTGSEKLAALRVELDAGSRIVALPADLRDPQAARQLGESVIETFGVPRRIVHLPASPLRYQRVAKLSWDRVEEDLNIQVRSLAVLLTLFLPELSKPPAAGGAPRPKIVFMLSSVTLGAPPKYMAEYTIAKFALVALMRSVAAEHPGINVNGISPSMIETGFLQKIPHSAVEMAAHSHPLGRNASADDIVGLMHFLLSEDSDYMTGVNIPVAGAAI